VVETIFPIYGLPDDAIQAVVTILVVGFVPVLVVSWAFELTPEGLKRDSEVDRSDGRRFGVAKMLDRVIMLVLALALSFFAIDKFVFDPSRDVEMVEEAVEQARVDALVGSYEEKSIAVLAFTDMSPDRDQEYLSDGIAEELLNLLAKIPELRVISRSSAFSFKGVNVDIPTMAKQLNVAHVLEGSVRKSGNRLRITAQLIDARTDSHLWSKTYDRTLDDVFAIQDEISAEVVEQLKITLLDPIPKSQRTDPEAYRLYLQAMYMINKLTMEGSIVAESLARQSLDLDPKFAPAWHALGWSQIRQIGTGPSLGEDIRRSQESNSMALEIDPEHAPSIAHLGWQTARFQGDIISAARLYERAIAIGITDANMARGTIVFAIAFGKPEEAIAVGEQALSRHPICFMCHFYLSRAYLYADRLEEAEQALRIHNTYYFEAKSRLAQILLLRGDAQTALKLYEEAEKDRGRNPGVSMALHSLGREEEAAAVFADFLTTKGAESHWFVAQAYAWMGQIDAAFEELDKAASESEPQRDGEAVLYDPLTIPTEVRSPYFRSLHDDPRWAAFLDKHGAAEEQIAKINFRVTLSP
jgi:TolB-like protein